jgi:glucose-1-phosphate adenylyltransferase
VDSIVSSGCIISGSRVMRSVLSPGVRVNSFSEVDRSILMPGVTIGRKCRVRHAILDTGVQLPEGSNVGIDAAEDANNGYLVTESGITVVPGPSQELARTAQ